MICVKSLHLDLNRVLLLLVGLWPYKQSNFVRLQLILSYSILASFITAQFMPLVTSKCTPQFVIEVLSSASFSITFLIEYNAFSLNMDVVKHSLEVLQHTYDKLRDEAEIAIIQTYGSIAKRYTNILTLLVLCVVLIFASLPFWTHSIGILLSGNDSLSHLSPQITTEYFIDQERYFYLIALHITAAFSIGAIAMLATGTIMLTCTQYACGMFKIASYRLEGAMIPRIPKTKSSVVNEVLICKRIIYAVDMHRKAMRFLNLFISKLEISFFLLIAFGMVSSSLNLFRVFQEIQSGSGVNKVIIPFIFIMIHSVYLMLGNNCAQQVMDHNNHLFLTVYNVQWYIAPLQIQKMILFLLQRGVKAFTLNLGGLFVGSLESAASLACTSISYFTVLYSTRQIE